MESQARDEKARTLIDQKLTELAMLAMKLCPEAKIEMNTVRYEDEDGRIKVFPLRAFRKRTKKLSKKH